MRQGDLEHFKEEMRKINRIFQQNDLTKLSRELASLQQIKTDADRIREAVQPIQEFARATRLPFYDFSRVYQQVLEAHEDLEELQTSDFPYRWLGALPLRTLRRLKHLYEEDRLDEVQQYIVDTLREEQTVEEFRTQFNKNPFFTDRLHIIDDVIQAHHENRYALSIPAAMAQIDGIIRAFAQDQGLRHNNVERALNALESEGDMFLGLFAEHLRDQFFQQQRNPVLHGDWLDYPGELLSAECLWVLYQLAEHSQRPRGPSEN